MMTYKQFSKAAFRFAQVLTLLFTYALLIFTNVVPAAAAPANNSGYRSNPRKGSERLDDVQKKSEEALRNPPLSMDRVQSESERGLNEVQGDADVQDTKNPANSQAATSIEEKAELRSCTFLNNPPSNEFGANPQNPF